jgi:hypothetical protein
MFRNRTADDDVPVVTDTTTIAPAPAVAPPAMDTTPAVPLPDTVPRDTSGVMSPTRQDSLVMDSTATRT